MPHIPKSKSTQKDLRNMIRRVQESAGSIASSAANRAKEEAKKRAKSYQDLKIKEFLLDSITKKIGEIKKKNSFEITGMYPIVEELCKVEVKDEIISEVDKKIEEFDNNPQNTTKINSTGIHLTKTIERDYMLYMIEFLVRSEIEKMKAKRISIQDIISVLNLEKSQNFEERGKALRLRVRAVVRPLYGLPEKEQRIDKLREETRTVMKNIAIDIDLKQKEAQYQKSVEIVSDDSNPDTDNR